MMGDNCWTINDILIDLSCIVETINIVLCLLCNVSNKFYSFERLYYIIILFVIILHVF